MALCLEPKGEFIESISLNFPKTPGLSLQSSDANRVQLERTPTKVQVKQDDSRQTNESGWAGALPISALFPRFLTLGALTITGVLLVIVRSRF